MRRATASVEPQDRGHFRDAELVHGGVDDHLARKFHPRSLHVEGEDRLALEPPEPAVKVTARAAEERPADGGEDRIAQVAVQSWHGAGLDPPRNRLPMTR